MPTPGKLDSWKEGGVKGNRRKGNRLRVHEKKDAMGRLLFDGSKTSGKTFRARGWQRREAL